MKTVSIYDGRQCKSFGSRLAHRYAELNGRLCGAYACSDMHSDIHVEPDLKDDEVACTVEFGARVIGTQCDRGPTSYALRDPEGNEFCLH